MKREGGFSLVETLVSLSLFGLVFAMVFPFLSLQKRVWMEQETLRDEFRTISSAVGWLTRDLQEAGYRCVDKPIHALEKDSIRYEISRDEENPSGFSLLNNRLVSVYLKGEDLMYRIQAFNPSSMTWKKGSTHTLASGLSDLSFRGLDRKGLPSQVPENVTAVEVELCGKSTGVQRRTILLRNTLQGGNPVTQK